MKDELIRTKIRFIWFKLFNYSLTLEVLVEHGFNLILTGVLDGYKYNPGTWSSTDKLYNERRTLAPLFQPAAQPSTIKRQPAWSNCWNINKLTFDCVVEPPVQHGIFEVS